VNVEVLAMDVTGMVSEGLAIHALAKNIIVKIPMTGYGLKAVHAVSTPQPYGVSPDGHRSGEVRV
jgi:transaldolase